MTRYEIWKEQRFVISGISTKDYTAKDLKDYYFNVPHDTFEERIETFATLDEAKEAFEKAKSACVTKPYRDSVKYGTEFDVLMLKEVGYVEEVEEDIDFNDTSFRDWDSYVDYDIFNDVLEVYVTDPNL